MTPNMQGDNEPVAATAYLRHLDSISLAIRFTGSVPTTAAVTIVITPLGWDMGRTSLQTGPRCELNIPAPAYQEVVTVNNRCHRIA